jgi:hypothetical protein
MIAWRSRGETRHGHKGARVQGHRESWRTLLPGVDGFVAAVMRS